jgi:hypothetical protein
VAKGEDCLERGARGRCGRIFKRRMRAPMGSISVELSRSLDSSPFDVGGDLRKGPYRGEPV